MEEGRSSNPGGSEREAKKRIDNLAGYAFISPFIIGFLCFTVIPMGASLFLSFTSYDLFTPPKWVGFDNYKAMLTDDEKYWGSLKVTFYYVLAGVPVAPRVCAFHRGDFEQSRKGCGHLPDALLSPVHHRRRGGCDYVAQCIWQ